jgi:hypothetical protein
MAVTIRGLPAVDCGLLLERTHNVVLLAASQDGQVPIVLAHAASCWNYVWGASRQVPSGVEKGYHRSRRRGDPDGGHSAAVSDSFCSRHQVVSIDLTEESHKAAYRRAGACPGASQIRLSDARAVYV